MIPLTERDVSSYHENGYVVVRGIVKPDAIRSLYLTTLNLFRKYRPAFAGGGADDDPWSDPSFHEAMIRFRQEAPELFGALYDSAQTSVALQQLCCDETLVRAAAVLLDEDETGLSTTGAMLRIDAPGDRRNRLEWHQESSYYTQNLSGEHGIVAWIPMQHLSLSHGPIMLCPGSHAIGKIPVESSGKEDDGTSEQYVMPAELIAQFETVSVQDRAGDAVLFHMDLFHRSGHNSSKEIRFVAGARYHRMLTADFVPGRLQYVENQIVRDQLTAASPV